LIVASVMSKKLAENLDRLVLDVKFGSGAFMKTKEDAQQLAESMKTVGESMKVKTSFLLSPMDEPLGRNVGNALEVAECVEVLQGKGPGDVMKLTLDLAEKVSEMPRRELEKRLKDGTAWKKFVSLVYAQDGDATQVEKLLEQHRATIIEPWPAKTAGVVKRMDAELIGRASVILGAGRQRTTDPIDFAVGFSGIKKLGERVEVDEPLFTIHARNERSIVNITPLLEKAIEIA
jgi:thymidine phosphorylase